jgi:hypothetical protein
MQNNILQKLMDGKVKFLPLSGGTDTRLIFSLIPQKIRKTIQWQTNLSPFLSQHSDKDVIIAKMIANKYGLRHKIDKTPLENEKSHLKSAFFFECTRPTDDWFNINGHYPSYLRDTLPTFLFSGNRPDGNENQIRFHSFLQKCSSILHDRPLNSGRWVNPSSLFLRSLRSPFLDSSVYRYVLTLPEAYLRKGRLFLHLIDYGDKTLFNIPFVQNHFTGLEDKIIEKYKVINVGEDYQNVRKKTGIRSCLD